MAGYSGTPLNRKLGIKEGFKMLIINPPSNYSSLVAPLPSGISKSSGKDSDNDFIHLFVKNTAELKKQLPELMKKIKQNGTIWVSWYKKSAGITTDVTEDVIRNVALSIGLVDIKVCAIDEQWSGLKLVIRQENRR